MIEINREKSLYTFRINPYAPTEIDCRENKHRARWFFHSRYRTPEEATAAILQIEKDDTK